MSILVAAIRLLRPKQWTKNLLVFAALIFTGTFRDGAYIVPALIAFAAMCAASSATYIFNDIQDRERDAAHPKKRKRPVASGEISPGTASMVAIFLLIVAIALGFDLGTIPLAIVAGYLVLQILYNIWLKAVPVADVYCIATGFVLRAVLGAAAIDVSISGWLLFCTAGLALMIGFGKRRNEFIIQGEDRAASRQSLIHYNRVALDALVVMFATAAALCFAVYTLQSRTATRYPGIIMTAPFVFYGITRYVLLVFTIDEGGEPEDILFKDPHLVASIVLFVAAAALAMSGVELPHVER